MKANTFDAGQEFFRVQKRGALENPIIAGLYKENDPIISASVAFHQAFLCKQLATKQPKKNTKMKAVIAVLCFVAAANAGVLTHVAPATVIARAPSLDSAVIQSDRIGGNFAYSVAESHAHVAHTPIIQHVAHPVAVSYSAPAVVAAPVVAAPIARTVVAAAPHHVVAAPIARAVVAAPHHVVAAPALHLAAHHVHSIGAPAATVRIA